MKTYKIYDIKKIDELNVNECLNDDNYQSIDIEMVSKKAEEHFIKLDKLLKKDR